MRGFKGWGVVFGASALLAMVPGCLVVVDDGCGDGFRDVGEECDDGNNRNGDGCSASCFIEGLCGDGIVDRGEECDDGNSVSGDGCSNCLFDVIATCGDGIVDTGEECDDGNNVSGDGCSNCLFDVAGFCGDGVVDPGEDCDDGANVSGDGCSADCRQESMGYLECVVGAMCGGRDQCIEIAIPVEGTRGAMCTHFCANDGECMAANGFSGACYELDGAAAVCYQRCAANADCFSGSTCIDVVLPGGVNDSVCVPNNL